MLSNHSEMYSAFDSVKSHSQEPILFEIKNYKGEVIEVVKGTTKQDINKPKVVNVNVKGGSYIVSEERELIMKVKNKYNEVWKKDVKQQREQLLETIKKETNWKLRVLNERVKEAKKKQDIMEAAEGLMLLSKQELKRKPKNKVAVKTTNVSLFDKSKPRRSSRIAAQKK
jgi:hypothetical protein